MAATRAMSLWVTAASMALAAAAFGGEGSDGLRAFYFGNSLTGATNPDWHGDLGKGAGKEWQNWAWLGAGWQLWQHREELAAGKDIFGAGSKGDLTLDENLIKTAGYHGKKFYGQRWDAVVLQLFGQYLTRETDNMWGRKLSGKKDVGDLGAASDLMRLYLKLNSEGRVFIYQVWAPMDSGEVPRRTSCPNGPGARRNFGPRSFPTAGRSITPQNGRRRMTQRPKCHGRATSTARGISATRSSAGCRGASPSYGRQGGCA